jgi:hypothetical protein
MAVRRLTEAAQADRDAYERLGDRLGCSCHISPPCTVCTHPGNPLNQEDEEFWEEEVAYTKDEALWYAICQMRRAARVMDIASIVSVPRDPAYRDIYGKGLDMCADECEKVIDPENLKRMKAETFPNESAETADNHG